MRPIVRNIQNNDLYEFCGGNKFINLRTGVSGEVPDDVAQKTLKFNLEATEIINEFPQVENLIKTLNLKYDHR